MQQNSYIIKLLCGITLPRLRIKALLQHYKPIRRRGRSARYYLCNLAMVTVVVVRFYTVQPQLSELDRK
jgi:hypothetical protein